MQRVRPCEELTANNGSMKRNEALHLGIKELEKEIKIRKQTIDEEAH